MLRFLEQEATVSVDVDKVDFLEDLFGASMPGRGGER